MHKTPSDKTMQNRPYICIIFIVLFQTQELADGTINVTSSNNTTDKRIRQSGQSEKFLATVYHQWTSWSECNRKCLQSRKRICRKKHHCGESYIKEKRSCKSGNNCPQKAKKNRIKLLGLRKNGKLVKEILYKILYGAWTPWSVCSRSCKKERRRNCIQSVMCGDSYLHEERDCHRGRKVCRKQYILRTYVSTTDDGNPLDKLLLGMLTNTTKQTHAGETNLVLRYLHALK